MTFKLAQLFLKTQPIKNFLFVFFGVFGTLGFAGPAIENESSTWNLEYQKIPSYFSNFVTLIPVGPFNSDDTRTWETARLFAEVGSVNPFFSETKIIVPPAKDGKALHVFYQKSGLLILPACHKNNLEPVFLETSAATKTSVVGNAILDRLKKSETCLDGTRFTNNLKQELNRIYSTLPSDGNFSEYDYSVAPGYEIHQNPFGASPTSFEF